MNKEKTKNILIIIMIIVIILLIIGLLAYKIFNNKNNPDNPNNPISENNEPGVVYPTEEQINSFDYRLRGVVDSVNYLNSLLSSTEYSDTEVYTNSKGQTCKRYTGENSDMYASVIDTIYEDPFSKDKTYYKEENETEIKLYVCKPDPCQVTELTTEDVAILSGDENQKRVKIKDKEYDFKKTEDIWRFSEAIINCQAE